MREDLLSPATVLEKVRWPNTDTVTQELVKARRQLVYVLTDRVNREETTGENQKAYTAAMAQIGFHYNPSGKTSIGFLSESKFVGGYQLGKNGSFGGSKAELSAVLEALSGLTGNQYKSISDII